MSDLIVPCEDTPQFLTRIPGSKFFQRCSCTWHCAILITAFNDQCNATFTGNGYFGGSCNSDEPFRVGGAGSSGNVFIFPRWIVNRYVIRSNAPAGTVIDLPVNDITMAGYQPGAAELVDRVTCSVTTSHTTHVTVGYNTEGTWEFLETFTASNGVVFSVYIATFIPSGSSPMSTIPEYAIPAGGGLAGHSGDGGGYSGRFGILGYDVSTMENPGPIKWAAGLALADSYGTHLLRPSYICYDAGGSPTTIPEVSGSLSSVTNTFEATIDGPGAPHTVVDSIYKVYCHAPLTLVGVACKLNAKGDLSPKLRSFNKAVFTTPGSKSTDDTFNLDVTFINPFTGLTIDGTHYFGNGQEYDYDTSPGLALFRKLADETEMLVGSITRHSYGNYTLNGCKFRCRKGNRKFSVYGNFERTSLFPVTQVMVKSGVIAVTSGAPAYFGFEDPQFPDYNPNVYQAAEVLLNNTLMHNLRAFIFDVMGHFERYNISDGATNTVTISLSDFGGNSIASPSISGTLVKAAVAGIVDLNDLKVHGLGRNYSLHMVSSGLAASHSDYYDFMDIEIKTGLRFQSLGTVVHGVALDIKVDLVDADGALLVPTTNIDNLTLAGGGSFSGFGSVAPSSGTATFHGSFPAAGTYTIHVKTSGVHYDGPGVAGEAETQLVVVVT